MMRWIMKMAYRELRRQRRRWIWTIAAIAIGTAAVSGVAALAQALRADIDHQIKSLLGADVMVSARQPFSTSAERLIDSIDGERADEVMFASMMLAKKSGGSRLIQVRAISGQYPFYGTIETDPPDAAVTYREGRRALVDDAVMIQYGLQPGDTIRLGLQDFMIAGSIKRMPGQAAAVSLVSPPVIIPGSYLASTQLIRRGSRVTYRSYLRVETSGVDLRSLKDRLRGDNVSLESADDRRAALGRAFDNVAVFLQLIGLMAFVLACVSIGSALNAYVRERWSDIAILRCLGTGWKPAMGIFLFQLAGLSAAGAALGILAGAGIQTILPSVVSTFLPVAVSGTVQWPTIAGIGLLTWLMTMTVSLIPLLPIRRISPLSSLRTTVELNNGRDYLQWAIAVVVLIGFSFILAMVMGTFARALVFVVGVIAILLILVVLSRSLTRLAKIMSRFKFSTAWKYAVSNLYRPGNQTRVMMVTIGLCVLMIGLIGLLDRGLVEQIALSDEGRQPNMVLFDIQTDQVDDVGERISEMGFHVLQRVPIVTMRLTAIGGRSMDDIRQDSTTDVPRWVGEFRSTYRDSLIETETLIAGRLREPTDSVWISMEESIARLLDVTVGDRLDFDVQGVPVTTYVGSLREVNWRRVQPNFYIVFPSSVLESAPQFYAMVTHVSSAEMSARLQRTLVQSFPNISIIDLRLILQTVEKVLQQLKWVIQFMSLFTVAVAVVILGSAVWTARFGRIKDSVVLRTIGASRGMIVRMTAGEFLIMTMAASIAGSLLAHVAAAFILNLIFDTATVSGWDWTTGTVLATVMIVVSLGLGLNRGVLTQSPLDVIRSEY